jgi:hypothetical protein
MKTQMKLWLAMAGSLIVGTGSAQTWTVNGTTQSAQLTQDAGQSAVAINPESGQVDLVTGGVAPTLTITAPGSVSVNQSFTVSYSATNFTPATCTASSTPSLNGWNGVVSGGTASVTAPGATGQVSLNLFCTRSGGSNVTATAVIVTVNNPLNCPGTPNIGGTATAPVTVVRGNQVFVSVVNFSDLFLGNAFPGGPSGTTTPLASLPFNEVRALQFEMPNNLSSDGLFSLSESSGGGGTGQPVLAISQCPGEARNLAPSPRSCGDGPTSQTAVASWTDLDNGFQFSNRRCQLTPGQTYYLNIALQCPNGSCGFVLKTLEEIARPAE